MVNNKDDDIVVLYSDKIDDTITFSSTASNSWSGTFSAANITAATSNWTANNNFGIGNSNLFYTNKNNPGLEVQGDASFSGDIKWQGRSLGEMLKKIEDRLAILVPDPEKLEHFEALKKAYEHYKVLEALCHLPSKEEK